MPLEKTFKKQIKTIEDQGEKQTKIIEEQGKKQVEALEALKPKENKDGINSVEGLFPKGVRTNETKNELYNIKKWEGKTKSKDLKYRASKYT